MAGKKPFALTGANALIKLGAKILAYATDFSFQAAMETLGVETLGRLEVVEYSLVGYRVSGSFSVIRYATKGGLVSAGGNGMPDAIEADNGNSMENMGFKAHMNPRDVITSSTFDIEVFNTKVGATAGTVDINQTLIKIIDARITNISGSINKRSLLTETFQFVGNLMGDTADTAFNYTDINGTTV